MSDWLNDFRQTIDSASGKLLQIDEAKSAQPRAEDHWSSKQIIGHLIDSAANNHARFVVGQLKDDLVFPGYDQEGWVRTNHYQERAWSELIQLWRSYNLHLHHLMTYADRAKLNTPCTLHTLQEIAFKTVPKAEPVTLEYLMQDYVDHMKHHLAQILGDDKDRIMSSAAKIFRLAILISGRGSNMAALIDAAQSGKIPHSQVAVVISDQTSAAGLQKAKACDIETLIIERHGRSREEHDREMIGALRERQIDLVCLAGYMRILSRDFIAAYRGRILNIHPSLLPAFTGLDAQRQALEHGVKVAGCTVHLVDETLDGGPIIAQRVVPIRADDTVETLSARILEQEHELYPEAVGIVLARAQATQAANS